MARAVFVVAVETIFSTEACITAFQCAVLQCIGLTTEYKGINWYVSPLFWSLLFYFGLHKLVKKEKNFCFFVALISYFGYVVIFNSDEGVLGRDIVFGFLSTALFRSLAGMGIGYLVAAVVTGLKENGVESRVRQSKLGNVLFTVCVSFAEIASLVLIFLNCFSEKLKCKNDLFVVIVFAVLLISLSFKCGLVSRIINNRFSDFWQILLQYLPYSANSYVDSSENSVAELIFCSRPCSALFSAFPCYCCYCRNSSVLYCRNAVCKTV